jgi:mannosylfructose-phosphate synthase
MSPTRANRIMMISTHGYVAASPEFGKPDTGGQVVYILEISKCLARMGFSVDIFTRQFERQPAVNHLDDRLRILRFPCGGDDFIPKEYLCEAIPEWVENVSAWMADEAASYALINSHYWDAGLAGQALANRFGISHVHTPHSVGSWKRDSMRIDPEEMERKYNFRKRIREEKVIYDECDLLIATTPVQRDVLVGSNYDVPADKIQVIPPGYDDQRFFPVSLASRRMLKAQFGLEGKTVLALGRMAKNKGYDLLLQAMPVVFARIPDARLVLAVGSTEPDETERTLIAGLHQVAERLGIEERVTFKGYISDDELPDYYRAADVFALSSRYEPFGMTAIEAMACGTPAVVTTEGGLCEQVVWGVESLYANPFDPGEFGHAIAAVLQHPRVAHQLAKFGPRKARSRFTWTGIAQQILASLETRRETRVDLSTGDFAVGEEAPEEATWSR